MSIARATRVRTSGDGSLTARGHAARWPLKVMAIASESLLTKDPADLFMRSGIELALYSDGTSALLALSGENPAAIIAPTDIQGVELPRFIRAVTAWCEIPILVGIGSEPEAGEHAYEALEHGARALVALPTGAHNLRDALHNLHIRAEQDTEAISIGSLTLDPQAFRVTVSGHTAHLSAREFELLHYLMQQHPRVVDPQELNKVLSLYDDGHANGTRSLVLKLRRKLQAASPGSGATIETVRGMGYRLGCID